MTTLLTFHLIALGIWIGVVGAEFFIEFDGMKDSESLKMASKLHFATDIWVEIPSFTMVLITGLLMLDESHFQGLFLYKVIFGLLAIFFNVVCVYAVFKRRGYALKNDMEGMASVDPIMKLGGLIIPCFIMAFVISMIFVFR